MNLDELQSIRDRERQSDSLQQLREDFYVEVGEFVQELRDEREAVADRADDPFDAPEVNRLTDDIKTAEQTVEAIYERRVGKLVKMASFAAADMPVEDEGLTAEERELFEQMVEAIEANRETVMAVVDGEDPPATPGAVDETSAVNAAETTTAPSGPADAIEGEPTEVGEGDTPADDAGDAAAPADSGRVDAADLMAGSGPAPEATGTDDEPVPPDLRGGGEDGAGERNTESDAPTEPDGRARGSGHGPTDSADASHDASAPAGDVTADAESSGQAGGGVDRETVRITADVGQILGVDEREYELTSEDVVTLPSENATPLVERDVAERLD